jgi:hypothetical protein
MDRTTDITAAMDCPNSRPNPDNAPPENEGTLPTPLVLRLLKAVLRASQDALSRLRTFKGVGSAKDDKAAPVTNVRGDL